MPGLGTNRGRRHSAAVWATCCALFLSSCALISGGKSATDPEGSASSSGFTCDDFELDRYSARPSNPVEITGVPSDFGDVPAFEMVYSDDESIMVPVDGIPGERGGFFVVPVLPSSPVHGSEVELQLTDGDGASCEAFEFTIEALPSAPGGVPAGG